MSDYFDGELGTSHKMFVARVSSDSRVLELGANSGYVTRQLAVKGCEVTAVEMDAACLARCSEHAAVAIQWNLNDSGLMHQLPHDKYDFILFGDVLEHLQEPASVLRSLSALMTGDSVILISLPNVAHWKTRLNLLRGKWDYEDRGTLDRTHLRFFTRNSALDLVASAGLQVEEVICIADSFPLDRHLSGARGVYTWKTMCNTAALKAAPGLLSYQLVLTARLPTTAG